MADTPEKKQNDDFSPDDYRMTIGEHLEELRWRLVLGLIGFVVALGLCLFFGQRVTAAFCAPLIDTLLSRDLNPQMFYSEVSDPFMVFIQISLISAFAISSPWVVYQLWQFVAAGLYPSERSWVTRYAPLSIGLLISGMLFVYFLVLPWTVQFFIDFGNGLPLPPAYSQGKLASVESIASTQPTFVAVYDGDPASPKLGQIWFSKPEGRLKMFVDPSKGVRVIPFGPQSLVAPHITLPAYIDLVMGMLLVFGLAFQLPLVVMSVARIGIVEVQQLKQWRRYVYFSMAVIAAAITPGDVLTATVALIFPLCLLYELGILLARPPKKSPDAADET